MLNDSTNSDTKHVKKLTRAFGVEITDKNINFVKNDNFPEGDVFTSSSSKIFKSNYKLFVKELVTLQPTHSDVMVEAAVGSDAVIVSRKYGKGKVVIVGDPWLYNEYVNGRKLPVEYQNLQASYDLIDWLLDK
jgi:unsaturated rhamnogalacturonyl hydrolase